MYYQSLRNSYNVYTLMIRSNRNLFRAFPTRVFPTLRYPNKVVRYSAGLQTTSDHSKQAYVIFNSIKLFSIAWAHISSRTCRVISVVWVVKRSILGLDILIDKGEIHTEEASFKRHKVSADRYFHLPNLVGQKIFTYQNAIFTYQMVVW